jgi:TonB family protein
MKGHVKMLKDREDEKPNPTGVQADVKESATRPLILYKEKANRTQESRDRGISGTVRLRAIFAADGSVKDILVIEGLEAGLSWKAVEAARAIRFKPATKGGSRSLSSHSSNSLSRSTDRIRMNHLKSLFLSLLPLLQLQFPGLLHEVMTEAVMRPLVNELEAGFLVDMSRGAEHALRP